MHGQEYFLQFIPKVSGQPYMTLDFGCGNCEITKALSEYSAHTIAMDIKAPHIPELAHLDIYSSPAFMLYREIGTFDIILASHVIEHMPDTLTALESLRKAMKDDGWLIVLVPPGKPEIVGGHVHTFNMGLLMYNLILAGFNVRDGHFLKRGYNICAYVQKSETPLPALKHDSGDIELLKDHWPTTGGPYVQGFNGNIERINWFE